MEPSNSENTEHREGWNKPQNLSPSSHRATALVPEFRAGPVPESPIPGWSVSPQQGRGEHKQSNNHILGGESAGGAGGVKREQEIVDKSAGPRMTSGTNQDPVRPSATQHEPVRPNRTQYKPVGPSRSSRTNQDPVRPSRTNRTNQDPVRPSRTSRAKQDPVGVMGQGSEVNLQEMGN